MKSRLLTYWTGKDISLNESSLDSQAKSKYVDRLVDIIERGLWMTVPDERLVGRGPAQSESYVRYRIPMTCFTELRASQASPHRTRYGLLGIVVDRSFVLSRRGGPVLYVRNHRDDGLIGNLSRVLEWIEDSASRGGQDARQAIEPLGFPIGFFKAMSAENTDDYAYLDEAEWRILHTFQGVDAQQIVATGQQLPRYRIPITPDDLKMIVVPDDEVRADAVKRLQNWGGGRVAPVLTFHEVLQL